MLSRFGVIARREHPHLQHSIEHLRRSGRLTTILPGVLVPAQLPVTLRSLCRAVAAWDRDAVITESAAARLTFWPDCPHDVISVATRRRSARRGFRLRAARIPAELIHLLPDGVQVTTPARTALDLCPALGGDSIDVALRTRAARFDDLWQAWELSRCRPGNAERLRLLLESRTEPWSRAERALHRLLHEAGIDHWQANRLIRVGDRRYYGDVVFRRARLVLEVDGAAFHADPTVFDVDRVRQNDLQLHGWLVLRFTWDRIHNDPAGVLSETRFALRHAAPRTRRLRQS
ncbi:MAG: endonuclease domain-containing protein [Propionibacteriales bacterium]|nr:endonuclease domain-containing protein [Propionibacteriales bacterium]